MNVQQQPLSPELQAFHCAVKACDRKPLTPDEQAQVTAAHSPCAKLGEIKHACVDEKMSKVPGVRTERSYDMSKRPPRVVRDSSGAETHGYLAAKAERIAQGLGPLKRPDAIVGKRAPYQVFDAKFPCSKKVRSRKVGPVNLSAGRSGDSMMDAEQREDYEKISAGRSKKPPQVHAVSPADARHTQC